jgi:hypothetical protein
MVSDGDGAIGASKVTGEVLDIIDSVLKIVKTTTGVELKGEND